MPHIELQSPELSELGAGTAFSMSVPVVGDALMLEQFPKSPISARLEVGVDDDAAKITIRRTDGLPLQVENATTSARAFTKPLDALVVRRGSVPGLWVTERDEAELHIADRALFEIFVGRAAIGAATKQAIQQKEQSQQS